MHRRPTLPTVELEPVKSPIATAGAPTALGPYSQGVRVGEWLFLAGQIGLDPGTGELAGPDAASQTRQILANLTAVLQAAGATPDALVKTTIYLIDLADFQEVNQVYASFLSPPFPARATIQAAALPKGARVEIDGIAHLP